MVSRIEYRFYKRFNHRQGALYTAQPLPWPGAPGRAPLAERQWLLQFASSPAGGDPQAPSVRFSGPVNCT